MNSPTIITLLGFIAWTHILLVLMETIRSKMVIFKEINPNGFNPENSNLSPFMQRLARVHANCIEGLPIFGGLMLIAFVTSNTNVTDGLAFVFLVARIIQSLIHLETGVLLGKGSIPIIKGLLMKRLFSLLTQIAAGSLLT